MKSLSLKIMLLFIIGVTIMTNISYANEITVTENYNMRNTELFSNNYVKRKKMDS